MKNIVHIIKRSRYMEGEILIYDYEESVLFHLAHYRTSTRIGKEMKHHKRLIEGYIQELFEKTGVPVIEGNEKHCRHQLVDWALQHGVLICEKEIFYKGSERRK